ncbi:MAG: transglutaminase domain-containing protein, partial [Flavisolibacter sp.]
AAGDGSNEANTAPRAVIEVFGDKMNIVDFIVDNPVYFSARDSFDPDGDDISYKWYVNGTEILNNYPQNSIISESDEELAYLFQEKGDYEISLTVSDGNLTNQAKKQIKVENQSAVIKQIKEHNFDIEIECRLENKGVTDLKDVECYLRTPQTYDPFQVINSIKTNITGGEEVFDDSWNLLSHFKFGKGTVVKKGEALKAIITASVTMYEYSFPAIDLAGKNYDPGDEDLSIYTTDDLFIDSGNPIIIEAAKKTVGNETDPVNKAKKLYKYVAAKLRYDFARAKENYDFMYASEILKIGKGVCADYAILYAALLRASGIPARVVGGIPSFLILGEKDQELDVGHAWTEVKLPGYGWIPIDITQEEGFMNTDHFLNLATEKGSSFLYESQTMDWTSYYFDGFKYKWDGMEQPEVDQTLIYRIKNLALSDMQVYGG